MIIITLIMYSLAFMKYIYFLPRSGTDSYCNLVRQFLSIIWRFGEAIGQANIRKGQFCFVLFCFGLVWCYSCVYNINETTKVLFTETVSTTAVLDLLIRILSAPNKIMCVLLVTVTISQHFIHY